MNLLQMSRGRCNRGSVGGPETFIHNRPAGLSTILDITYDNTFDNVVNGGESFETYAYRGAEILLLFGLPHQVSPPSVTQVLTVVFSLNTQ